MMAAKKTKRKPSRTIQLTDPMAEAGRKIFAAQIRLMQKHEAGSRSGVDIEDLHQMRVAIRRMRSLFNLIGAHYRAKTADRYVRALRDSARALGAIRDLDVLILDLQDFAKSSPEDEQATMADLIALLEARRTARRRRLNKHLDSKQYRRFVRQFRRLAKKPGSGNRRIKRRELPHQVRHVLPLLLHRRLARVRAYDTVLPAADDTVLHALRVEFKQLRYAVEFFQPVIGSTAGPFLEDVKAMQNLLGRLNDIAVFTDTMTRLPDLPPRQATLVDRYVVTRASELVNLRERFALAWTRFNSRATQGRFADALLVLR